MLQKLRNIIAIITSRFPDFDHIKVSIHGLSLKEVVGLLVLMKYYHQNEMYLSSACFALIETFGQKAINRLTLIGPHIKYNDFDIVRCLSTRLVMDLKLMNSESNLESFTNAFIEKYFFENK